MTTHKIAITDGGLETTLLFQDGFELPCFAAFPLVADEHGREALRRYFEPFLALADARGTTFVLDTPTWRANPDWGAQLGYSPEALAAANREAVAFARDLSNGRGNVIIDGMVGPRGDGYVVGERMSIDAAAAYHAWQINVLEDAGAERITALTLSYAEEAAGVVRAAVGAGLPVVIGFTVETDGRLPDGTSLGEAIAAVDRATDTAAEFFLVNCAHPTHVAAGLTGSPAGLERIGGLRFNASSLSHAELDEAEELDEGDPAALAADALALRALLPGIRMLGGCCGTDHRHVGALAAAWEDQKVGA